MYTNNPHLPKVRRDAVRLVKYRGWSTRKVARHTGYNQSTIVRWCTKDPSGGWHEIPTRSSRHKTMPRALSRTIVSAIVAKRSGRQRCGQVVHQELLRDGVKVSLSSVQRTLDRLHLLKKRSPWKRPHDWTPRPEPAFAGALIEVDTIHIICPDGRRIYVYTLIDLYSRWAYAEIAASISATKSALIVLRAGRKAPFRFQMIQSDHGSEFSIRFSHTLKMKRIEHRHSRVKQKDDQAHIERFNRTIQEECFERTTHTIPDFKKALKEYLPYYNNERLHMGINYQTPLEVLRRC